MRYAITRYQLYSLSIFFFIVCIGFFSRTFLYRIITPQKYHVTYDSISSKVLQSAITRFLSTYTWKSCATFVKDIKTNFPSIESVEILIQPCQTAYIDIVTQEPRFIINDSFVLTYYNTLHTIDFFQPHICNNKPYIYIHDIEKQYNETLLHTLHTIDIDIYEQFILEWQSPDSIYLHNKKNKLWHLVCNTDSIIQKEIDETFAIIATQKDIITAHIIDTRFSDQIIVYKDTGELYG